MAEEVEGKIGRPFCTLGYSGGVVVPQSGIWSGISGQRCRGRASELFGFMGGIVFWLGSWFGMCSMSM